MTIASIIAKVKEIRIREVVCAWLLIVCIWENRPSVLYINQTHAATGEVLYNICLKQHRWGTTTNCYTGNKNYYEVETMYKQSLQRLDDMSWRKQWRMY